MAGDHPGLAVTLRSNRQDRRGAASLPEAFSEPR